MLIDEIAKDDKHVNSQNGTKFLMQLPKHTDIYITKYIIFPNITTKYVSYF